MFLFSPVRPRLLAPLYPRHQGKASASLLVIALACSLLAPAPSWASEVDVALGQPVACSLVGDASALTEDGSALTDGDDESALRSEDDVICVVSLAEAVRLNRYRLLASMQWAITIGCANGSGDWDLEVSQSAEGDDDWVLVATATNSQSEEFEGEIYWPLDVRRVRLSLDKRNGCYEVEIFTLELFGEAVPAIELPAVTGGVAVDVFGDDDADDLRGSGEAGLEGATVTLAPEPVSGSPVGLPAVLSATTDASGSATFGSVPEGQYRVDVDPTTLPPGRFSGSGTATVTVVAGEEASQSFGFVRNGTVTATVWADEDQDRTVAPGEPLLAGVDVEVVQAGADGVLRTPDDVVIAATTSGPDGTVGPVSVEPGEYDLRVRQQTLPAGYAPPSVVEGMLVAVAAAGSVSASLPVWRFAGAVPVDVVPGKVVTIAGSSWSDTVDGVGSDASFESTTALAVEGSIAVVAQPGRLRTVDLVDATVSTVVGGDTQGCVDSTDPAAVTLGTSSAVVVRGDSAYLGSETCNSVRKVSLATGITSTVASFGQPVRGLAALPDGRLVAAVGQDLTAIDTTTGATSVLTTDFNDVGAVGVSPTHIWYGGYSDQYLHRWSFQTGTEELVTELPFAPSTIAPSSQYVHVASRTASSPLGVPSSRDGEVLRYDPVSDELELVAGSHPNFGYADGTGASVRFVGAIEGVASVPGGLIVLDATTVRRITPGAPPAPGAQSPLVESPLALEIPQVQSANVVDDSGASFAVHDGRVFMVQQSRLYELDLAKGWTYQLASLPCGGQVVSDGVQLWLSCGDAINPELMRVDPETGATYRTGIELTGARVLTVAPDGSLLTTDGNSLIRLDLEGGASEHVASLPAAPGSIVADGDSVWASVGSPSRIVRVDLQTGDVATLVEDSELGRLFASTRDYLYTGRSPWGNGILRYSKADGSRRLIGNPLGGDQDGIGDQIYMTIYAADNLDANSLILLDRYQSDTSHYKIKVLTEAQSFSARGAAIGLDGYGAWAGLVNTGLGAYTTQTEDLSISGAGPELAFRRTYSSADDRLEGPLGAGWSHNYDMSWISDDEGRIAVRYPDGRSEVYTPDGTGGFDPPPGYYGTLVATGSGYELTAKDRTRHVFDSTGKLTSIVDADGNTLTLTYSAGRLATVTAASGRTLTFTWSSPNRITSVTTDPVAGVALSWTYTYQGNQLASACDPRHTTAGPICTSYEYDVGGRLRRMVRPEGNDDVRVGYTDDGRVEWTENGVGDRTTFAYGVGSTVSEDGRGNRRTQRYDDRFRLIEEVDHDGNAISYGYDARGYRNTITDANNTTTTLSYDDRGNVLSQTNGEGEITWQTYSTGNDLLSTADGRSADATDATYRTVHTYDAAGNRLTSTTPPTTAFPTGVTTTWAYTTGSETAIDGGTMPPGLLRTSTDGNGHTTTYAYDAQGDLRTTIDGAGLVTDYDHDELGRLTAVTAYPDGHATGTTSTYTYDKAGNQLTATGPAAANVVSGATHQQRVTTTFDANNRPTESTVADLVGIDPARTTRYGYDDADRETSATLVDFPTAGQDLILETRVFDAAGNVATVTDAEQRRLRTDYDARDLPIRTTLLDFDADPDDPSNPLRDLVIEQRGYDAAGRHTSTTDANGTITRRAYDRADRLVATTIENFTDADGTVRELTVETRDYDNAGNLIRTEHGSGRRVTTHAYDEAGRTIATTLDPGGLSRTTTLEHDANGNVTRQVTTQPGADTIEVRRTFDHANNQPTSETVENGAVDLTTWKVYDNRGLLIGQVDPRGTSSTDAAHTITTRHDALGRPFEILQPPVDTIVYGGTTATVRPTQTIGYDTFGNPTHRRDPNGNTTITDYDRLDRQIIITHPGYTAPGETAITPTETFDYDAVGNLTARTSRRGHTTSWTYDDLNRPIRQTDPPAEPGLLAGVTTRAYDDVGNLVGVIDPTGVATDSGYDRLSRQTFTTAYDGATPLTTQTRYDDLGNVTATIDATGATTGYTHDAAGNVTTMTDPAGAVWHYEHDAANRTTAEQDPAGRRVEHDLDLAGRETATRTVPPNGSTAPTLTVTRQHDRAGNVTAQTTARGFTTSWDYDATNRLSQVVTPVDATTTVTVAYGYDLAGNLTRQIDGNGNATWHTYTTWNLRQDTIEPATAAHPALADRTFTTVYDAGGLPIEEHQPGTVTVTRTFDALGRATDETGSGASATAATRTRSYDAAGRLTRTSHPSGWITIDYDTRGLPQQVAGPAGTTSWQYDAAGRIVERTDPAGTATFTWTPRGELETATDPLTEILQSYDWTDDGRLDTIGYGNAMLPDLTRAYTYDDYGRLDTDSVAPLLADPVWSVDYSYDADGNVTTKTITAPGNPAAGTHTHTYDRQGRLDSWTDPSTTVTAYSWDANGNRLAAGTDTYTYDERNRLTTAPDGTRTYTPRGTLATAAGGTVTYSFDGLGRMTDQTRTGQTATYTYDALDRIATRDTTTFLYTGLGLDPTVDGTHTYGRSPAGRLLALQATGTDPQLAILDRHGDLTGWIDSDNNLAGSRIYDPFGDPIGTTGTANPSAGFQADWTDPLSGETWQGSRWYQPTTGTFTARDTVFGELSTPVTLNRYLYARGNPLRYFDPDGRYGFDGTYTARNEARYGDYDQDAGSVGRASSRARTTRALRANERLGHEFEGMKIVSAEISAAHARRVAEQRGRPDMWLGAARPVDWDVWTDQQRNAYIAARLPGSAHVDRSPSNGSVVGWGLVNFAAGVGDLGIDGLNLLGFGLDDIGIVGDPDLYGYSHASGYVTGIGATAITGAAGVVGGSATLAQAAIGLPTAASVSGPALAFRSGATSLAARLRAATKRTSTAPRAPRLNLPFRDSGLRSQVDDVVRHFDEVGRPPTGVAQGGLRGHPRGTYGGQGLPDRPLGYYTESDVWTSGGGIKRGAERLVFGQGGEVFYTPNHYDSFVRIR